MSARHGQMDGGRRSRWWLALAMGFVLGVVSAALVFRLTSVAADTEARQLAQDIAGVGNRLDSAVTGVKVAPPGSSVFVQGRSVGAVMASVEYRARGPKQRMELYVVDYGSNEALVRSWGDAGIVGLLTQRDPIRIEVTKSASLGAFDQIGELTVAGARPIPVVVRNGPDRSGT